MVFVKKMVCEGFKSFRRKTIINFDKGFTGIVGANGSGKSNIKVIRFLERRIPVLMFPFSSILFKCLWLFTGSSSFIFLPRPFKVIHPSKLFPLDRFILTNLESNSASIDSILGLPAIFFL